MDINVAGCTLNMRSHPAITCKYYAGAATALNAAATYPYDKAGIAGTGMYQHALPPMVGMLVKWKDVQGTDQPAVEMVATGSNGNLVVGFIKWIEADYDLTDTYINVGLYIFQPGDILKLMSSNHGSATIPVFRQGVSFYTGERMWQVDNTNGFGQVIKLPPVKGDDFLLMITKAGGGL
jgi:hypothetical protein